MNNILKISFVMMTYTLTTTKSLFALNSFCPEKCLIQDISGENIIMISQDLINDKIQNSCYTTYNQTINYKNPQVTNKMPVEIVLKDFKDIRKEFEKMAKDCKRIDTLKLCTRAFDGKIVINDMAFSSNNISTIFDDTDCVFNPNASIDLTSSMFASNFSGEDFIAILAHYILPKGGIVIGGRTHQLSEDMTITPKAPNNLILKVNSKNRKISSFVWEGEKTSINDKYREIENSLTTLSSNAKTQQDIFKNCTFELPKDKEMQIALKDCSEQIDQLVTEINTNNLKSIRTKIHLPTERVSIYEKNLLGHLSVKIHEMSTFCTDAVNYANTFLKCTNPTNMNSNNNALSTGIKN